MSGRGARVFALVLALFLAPSLNAENADEPLRVLFIGNSLTPADLPAAVSYLAVALGHPAPDLHALTRPNSALEDHWRSGRVEEALADGPWDVVVMQQGPSSTAANQANLAEWSARIATAAREHGARPALYMVWPSAERFEDFAGVIESYSKAAAAAQADLYPVGASWLAAWQIRPGLFLYSRDGFHPSAQGTTLAALVVTHGLYGEIPDGLPKGWRVAGRKVSTKESEVLLRAARQIAEMTRAAGPADPADPAEAADPTEGADLAEAADLGGR